MTFKRQKTPLPQFDQCGIRVLIVDMPNYGRNNGKRICLLTKFDAFSRTVFLKNQTKYLRLGGNDETHLCCGAALHPSGLRGEDAGAKFRIDRKSTRLNSSHIPLSR